MKRSSFIFEENHVFLEGETPQTKLLKLRKNQIKFIYIYIYIYIIYGIGNLIDLPRIIFIDEECGNHKVVVDGGQFTRNNNKKRKSEIL